ncbi:hypothetical protein ACWEOO_21000 [Kribbella sp. NPDC004138]
METFGFHSGPAGHGGDSVSRAAGSGTPNEPERRLYVDHVRTFETLADLREASTAIVRATAEEQRSAEISGIPTTITKLTVTNVVWGKVAGPDVELRQLGVAGQLGNASEILESGAEYLIFLVPSTGADDAAPNRYLIAGDVGLYELHGEQYVLRGGDLPPEGRNRLPAKLVAATAEAQVTS